jgi:hypothetical protein
LPSSETSSTGNGITPSGQRHKWTIYFGETP